MSKPHIVKPKKPAVGWREWVSLPDLGIGQVKAKIDTGARSSSLHVTDLEITERDGITIATFMVHPLQRSHIPVFAASAPVLESRIIRSSNGHSAERPVIITRLRLGELEFPIELTLTGRDEMGFRLLIGREALRRRLLVDPGRSYLLGKKTI